MQKEQEMEKRIDIIDDLNKIEELKKQIKPTITKNAGPVIFVTPLQKRQALASLQMLPLDYTFIKRQTGISTPNIKKVLQALEAVFLIRLTPIEGSTQGYTVFFEDIAEYNANSETEPDLLQKIQHFCFTDRFSKQFFKSLCKFENSNSSSGI